MILWFNILISLIVQSTPIDIHPTVDTLALQIESSLSELNKSSISSPEWDQFKHDFRKTAPFIITTNVHEFKRKSAHQGPIMQETLLLDHVGNSYSDLVHWVSQYGGFQFVKRANEEEMQDTLLSKTDAEATNDLEEREDTILSETDLKTINYRKTLQKRVDDLKEHLDHLHQLQSSGETYSAKDVKSSIKYTTFLMDHYHSKIQKLDSSMRLCKKSGCARNLKTKLKNLADAPLRIQIKTASAITLGGTALALLYALFLNFVDDNQS